MPRLLQAPFFFAHPRLKPSVIVLSRIGKAAPSKRTAPIAASFEGRPRIVAGDCGVLVPGVSYFQNEKTVAVTAPAFVLRLMNPLTRGANVRQVQRFLIDAGFFPGRVDGIIGPQTAHAVRQFQNANGLVPDGEVGPATLKAMKIKI